MSAATMRYVQFHTVSKHGLLNDDGEILTDFQNTYTAEKIGKF